MKHMNTFQACETKTTTRLKRKRNRLLQVSSSESFQQTIASILRGRFSTIQRSVVGENDSRTSA